MYICIYIYVCVYLYMHQYDYVTLKQKEDKLKQQKYRQQIMDNTNKGHLFK